MRAIVERNGSLNGELFIECSHKPDGVHLSALRFSVPVTAEIPIGTEVEITCEVVEVPVVKPETPPGDVTAVTAAPAVVEESPIVGEEEPPTVDTAPSGQTEPPSGHLPDGFPGLTALEAASEATFAKVRRRVAAGTLTEIPGIGSATAESITEALAEAGG